MMELDEDALLCDFAEFYHLFNYKDLPLQTVATLACGLRETSRIYRKMSDCDYNLDTLLLARIYDACQMLLYFKTKDGQKGINRPEMMLDRLLSKGKDSEESNYMVFDTPEEFDTYMRKKRGENNV